MKVTAFLLNIALLAETFCTLLQQSFAQTNNNLKGVSPTERR